MPDCVYRKCEGVDEGRATGFFAFPTFEFFEHVVVVVAIFHYLRVVPPSPPKMRRRDSNIVPAFFSVNSSPPPSLPRSLRTPSNIPPPSSIVYVPLSSRILVLWVNMPVFDCDDGFKSPTEFCYFFPVMKETGSGSM